MYYIVGFMIMNEWANKGPILSALNFHRNLFTLLLLNQDILTNLGAGWLEHVPTFFQKLLIIFLLYFWDKNYYSPNLQNILMGKTKEFDYHTIGEVVEFPAHFFY